MSFLLYLFGFLPSIIWLAYYLSKDKHPESNRMVFKVFGFGMASGVCAILLEKMFEWSAQFLNLIHPFNPLVFRLGSIFLGVALIEETVKYGAVRLGVFHNPELDEPVDFMVYMIIAGLGFAALENILILINEYYPFITSLEAVQTMGVRFVSATFLHALCSGTLGYFLALSFLHFKRKGLLFFTGLGTATLLHGMYNFAIMELSSIAQFLIPFAILMGSAIFISYGFKKIKRSKTVCKY